ncbi:MAG: Veg family protein [Clostridia bacterium]|nr:Veg family protein [Clostridia bacterium]
MIEKKNINEVKKNIEGCVGQKVLLRGSLGRNKSFEKEGTLVNTYPNIFVVKMDDSQRNVTYSYTDVLTKSVELGVDVNGSYNSILDSMNPEITF